MWHQNNVSISLSFRLFVAMQLAVILSSCGYHDELHMRHHQLGLLWNYRFAELETSLDEQYALYKKGKLKGVEFSRQIFSIEHANEGADKRFEEYVKTYPDSRWSHLLYGLYLVQKAKEARGDETYNTTPQSNFDKMAELAEQAKEVLETAHGHDVPFGLYAGGMIHINRMLQTKEENKSIVDEALARDGDIWRAPVAYFTTLYPQWGGSEQAMVDFIVEVKRKNPKLAKALEADFYWRRGKDYSVHGDVDAAISTYEKAVNIYPDDYALKDLGELYMQKGQCDAAVDVLKRNLEENDAWDLWTLESLAQANDCAGNGWAANRSRAKRSELFDRFRRGE